MDEKILAEMARTLQEIKISLSGSSLGHFRGPIADPGPEWRFPPGNIIDHQLFNFIRGPVADPAPIYLLGKEKLAILKVNKLDAAIAELNKQIDTFSLERDLLKEEFNIK